MNNDRQTYKSGCPKVGRPPTGFEEKDVGVMPDDSVILGKSPDPQNQSWCACKVHTEHCRQKMKVVQHLSPMYGRFLSRSTISDSILAACCKLSDFYRSEFVRGTISRLWLDVGVLYSNFLEYDSAAAIHSAGPEASRRIGNWHRVVLPIPLFNSYVAEWNSGMIESMRLVLRRWRGVCSFSQTMRSTWSDEESHAVYDLRSGNNVGLPVRRLFGGPARGLYCGPARLLSGGEHDKLKSYSMALKI